MNFIVLNVLKQEMGRRKDILKIPESYHFGQIHEMIQIWIKKVNFFSIIQIEMWRIIFANIFAPFEWMLIVPALVYKESYNSSNRCAARTWNIWNWIKCMVNWVKNMIQRTKIKNQLAQLETIKILDLQILHLTIRFGIVLLRSISFRSAVGEAVSLTVFVETGCPRYFERPRNIPVGGMVDFHFI